MCKSNDCHNLWRSEFQKEKFLFGHPTPDIFHRPQCQGSHLAYVVWRWLVCFYFGAILLWSIVDEPEPRWFLSVGNWGVLLATFTFLAQASTATYHYRNYSKLGEAPPKTMPFYSKMSWFLLNVTNSVMLFVTIGYWALIYNSDDGFVSPLGLNLHIITFLVVMLNFFITQEPVRLLHFYNAQIFFAIYIAFAAIVWKETGEVRYGFVDPNDVGKTVGLTLGIIFLVVPLIQVICFIFYIARESMYKACTGVLGCCCICTSGEGGSVTSEENISDGQLNVEYNYPTEKQPQGLEAPRPRSGSMPPEYTPALAPHPNHSLYPDLATPQVVQATPYSAPEPEPTPCTSGQTAASNTPKIVVVSPGPATRQHPEGNRVVVARGCNNAGCHNRKTCQGQVQRAKGRCTEHRKGVKQVCSRCHGARRCDL